MVRKSQMPCRSGCPHGVRGGSGASGDWPAADTGASARPAIKAHVIILGR